MQSKKVVSIIGGDERQIYIIRHFVQNGYIVKIIGFENSCKCFSNVIICNDIANAVSDTDYIIFGIPITKNNVNIYTPLSDKKILIDEIFMYADNNAKMYGGRITKKINEMARIANIKIYDYFENDMFAYLNAIPTAEGCIKLIIENSQISIDGMKCLITGFGKVSKILANKLKKLNAEVTIAARNRYQLSEALAFGYNVCDIANIETILSDYDTVINTVPAMIFNEFILNKANEDTIFIDLASLPGGMDFGFAAKKNIIAIQALGLPAKTAPSTAGEIIYKVICTQMEEE